MGKIKGNPITRSFSGAFDDTLVFRTKGSETFFARKGVNRKPRSPLQIQNQNRFAKAHAYALEMLADPEKSELYAAMAAINNFDSAHVAARSDFMSSPEIESIDTKKFKGRQGDVIAIIPTIKLKIIKMEVTLHHVDGSVLESGPAIKDELKWAYSITVKNEQVSGSRVTVVAYDRHGQSCTEVKYVK